MGQSLSVAVHVTEIKYIWGLYDDDTFCVDWLIGCDLLKRDYSDQENAGGCQVSGNTGFKLVNSYIAMNTLRHDRGLSYLASYLFHFQSFWKGYFILLNDKTASFYHLKE